MKPISLFFKITYLCNYGCSFCIAYQPRKDRVPDLSLDNIIANVEFFSRTYSIKKIVLTGGEPTLHPEFFKILKYFQKNPSDIVLLTNAINFVDEKFLTNTRNHLFANSQNNLIIFSFNDYINNKRTLNAIVKRKFAAIVNLAKSGLCPAAIITISKNNVDYLYSIVEFIINLKKKYNFNLKYIEIRMLYLGAGSMNEEVLSDIVPHSYSKVKISLERAILLLKEEKINYNLWNFPLCYLSDPKKHSNKEIGERIQTNTLMIDANNQLGNARIHNWEKRLLDYSECEECVLKDRCGGICSDFIHMYNYPFLKTVK